MVSLPTRLIQLLLPCAATFSLLNSAAAQTDSVSYFLSVQDGRARLVDGVPAVGSADDSLAVIEVSGNELRVRHQLALAHLARRSPELHRPGAKRPHGAGKRCHPTRSRRREQGRTL